MANCPSCRCFPAAPNRRSCIICLVYTLFLILLYNNLRQEASRRYDRDNRRRTLSTRDPDISTSGASNSASERHQDPPFPLPPPKRRRTGSGQQTSHFLPQPSLRSPPLPPPTPIATPSRPRERPRRQSTPVAAPRRPRGRPRTQPPFVATPRGPEGGLGDTLSNRSRERSYHWASFRNFITSPRTPGCII